jgi:hypothetical protein
LEQWTKFVYSGPSQKKESSIHADRQGINLPPTKKLFQFNSFFCETKLKKENLCEDFGFN